MYMTAKKATVSTTRMGSITDSASIRGACSIEPVNELLNEIMNIIAGISRQSATGMNFQTLSVIFPTL